MKSAAYLWISDILRILATTYRHKDVLDETPALLSIWISLLPYVVLRILHIA